MLRRFLVAATAGVALTLALGAAPTLACPRPDSPIAGQVRSFVAKHEGRYASQAREEFAQAEARMDRLAYGVIARTIQLQAKTAERSRPLRPFAAGPRACDEDVRSDGRRKMSYCLKIYGLNNAQAFGAVDFHAWAWRDGVGWITWTFMSMTLNYTKFWHKGTPWPNGEPIFSFGQSATEFGCSLSAGGGSSGCSIPNSSQFTLYSLASDFYSACTNEQWSTGNYTDLSYRDDENLSRFVPRFFWRSPYSGF